MRDLQKRDGTAGLAQPGTRHGSSAGRGPALALGGAQQSPVPGLLILAGVVLVRFDEA